MIRIGNSYPSERTAEQKAEARKTPHKFMGTQIPAYAGSHIAAIRASEKCFWCGEGKDFESHAKV